MEISSIRYTSLPTKRAVHLFTSPPHLRRIHHLRHHDVILNPPPMRHSNLQRLTTALNPSHLNPIQSTFLDLNIKTTMTDSEPKKNIKSGDGPTVVKDINETQKPPEVPPPPEKPLPGDCCGSGCVRCVWDVYYDELEEYNKQLVKDGSDNTTGS